VFYPITPSTEGGEIYQQSFASGELNVWGQQKVAVETEGEHAAQGGATAYAVQGRRTVNFTSGQGIVYAMEQYYHAPGKLSTMVLEVGARALKLPQRPLRPRRFLPALDRLDVMMAKDAQRPPTRRHHAPVNELLNPA
jgi:pyruvate/2-oxoacid:ferredoxin oxidoreductase alpha subunit